MKQQPPCIQCRERLGKSKKAAKLYCVQTRLKDGHHPLHNWDRDTHNWRTITKFRDEKGAHQSLTSMLTKRYNDLKHLHAAYPDKRGRQWVYHDRLDYQIINSSTGDVIYATQTIK